MLEPASSRCTWSSLAAEEQSENGQECCEHPDSGVVGRSRGVSPGLLNNAEWPSAGGVLDELAGIGEVVGVGHLLSSGGIGEAGSLLHFTPHLEIVLDSSLTLIPLLLGHSDANPEVHITGLTRLLAVNIKGEVLESVRNLGLGVNISLFSCGEARVKLSLSAGGNIPDVVLAVTKIRSIVDAILASADSDSMRISTLWSPELGT